MTKILKTKYTIWSALAHASLLDSLRRKDLYVSLILSVVMIGAAATIGTFGVRGLEMFLKDVTLTVINLLSVLLAVLFSARQMPEEMERRTIYPLLARPLSRADLLVGKFLGAYALSLLSLLLFTAIGWGALACFGLSAGAIFWQYLFLRALSLGLICALTLALSLFLTSGATVTIALLLTLGASTFSQAVLLLDGGAGLAARFLLRGSYYVFPHLDLFDLSKKVSYGWQPVGSWVMTGLAVYASLYVVVFLSVGIFRFQRRSL